MGIAGNKGAFTAFALEGGIPPLLSKGAMEALGGQVDFLRGSSNFHWQGVQIPQRVNRARQYILSVVGFRKDPSTSAPKCPEASASFFSCGS